MVPLVALVTVTFPTAARIEILIANESRPLLARWNPTNVAFLSPPGPSNDRLSNRDSSSRE